MLLQQLDHSNNKAAAAAAAALLQAADQLTALRSLARQLSVLPDLLPKGLQPQPWLTLQTQQHPTVLLQQSWAQSLALRCLHRPLARLLVIQPTGSSSCQGQPISRCWTLKRDSKAAPWLLGLAPPTQAAAELALVVLRVLCQQQDLVETQQQQAQ